MDSLIAREISQGAGPTVAYSFCTVVNRLQEYADLVKSLQAYGFAENDCEYLYYDNSGGNAIEAYSAYNRFLQEARGDFIVLCHQDILPISDGRACLDERLAELTRLDSDWGLCGNAGALDGNRVAHRITDPSLGSEPVGGPFPVKVMNLDENFIVVRREANLATSHDLSGFHWYGSDLCLIADVLGWNAYVIDFHLQHRSAGNQNPTYTAIRWKLARKYRRAFRPRWYYAIGTQTHSPTLLANSPIEYFLKVILAFPLTTFAWLWVRRVLRRLPGHLKLKS